MNVHIKKMYVTIATFSIMGVILSVSVIAFLFSFQGNFENRYIRITTLVFTMVTVSTHILYVGQLIEDAAFQVYTTLKTVDWNNWNLENRKLYLIYLQNAQIIFSIKFTQDVSINYRLGFSMAKAIYSMISVMSKLRNVDYSKI
nr:PREDICTED: uncharacterized protein LOC107397448 isoform X1 [Tribolium castaneum]XP_015832974.1 PREDICTED: uncharacterized protein LOC107397448 isoform X1 [Tribolium castaneum]|eukprot:XP_015832973.1 PREDICTED: uncharacterized protein LOC107397448 isoform X1 [Tribolium castaneum]